jgi:solute carrier family 25 citrate transporter 1
LITQVGTIPKAGIRFGGNAYFKQLLADDKGKLNMAQQFLAGMGAGVVEAVFAVTPMETIKTKLIQTNQSLIPGMRSIFQESGIAGFYQGVTATILKQSSNQGIRFMCFNKYKDVLTDNGKTKLSVHASFIGGLFAGCCSVLGNNPIDVVKTRMQGKEAVLYKNTLDCFLRVAREEGIRGLYKGALPRMGRVVPGQVCAESSTFARCFPYLASLGKAMRLWNAFLYCLWFYLPASTPILLCLKRVPCFSRLSYLFFCTSCRASSS